MGQRHTDEVLLPLLAVSDGEELEQRLVQIVSEHADPVIKDIIKYKLRGSEPSTQLRDHDNYADDIRSDAIVQLLARLREFTADPQQKAISNLRSYVAVIAYNSCYRHLRRIYPQRHILKNRLRYLLTRQSDFALWEGTNRELMCGFAVWRDATDKSQTTDNLRKLHADPGALSESGVLVVDAQRAKPGEVLSAIFTFADCPLKLDDLVNIVARLWGIKDQESSLESEVETGAWSGRQADFAVELDQQEYLKKLWTEVIELPKAQRSALLLNLRDGDGRGCIELFHLSGVATIKQIAEALDVPLLKFAPLWNELPLDDLTIATRLALTRQQVINLRKSARARLSRRMKVFR